jgi:peptidoglycan/xylan/chitin deacetylase (PgdA/CDA1 family)
VNELLNFCNKHSDIYIYGAGVFGRIISVFLRENGIIPKAFLVSQNRTGINSVLDLPVLSVDDLDDHFINDSGIVVAAAEENQLSILQVISESGAVFNSEVFSPNDKELNDIKDRTKFIVNYPVDNNVNVLIYHRVIDISLDTRNLCIKPCVFEEQIKFLKDNYKIVRADDEWDDSESCVVITFDDGYFDFYENVLPLLEKYHVPATVFVSTDFIDKYEEIWGDELERVLCFNGFKQFEYRGKHYCLRNEEERRLTLLELREVLKAESSQKRASSLIELANILDFHMGPRETHRIMTSSEICECSKSDFVTIGAHTASHCCLSSEMVEIQREQIIKSKQVLENLIGREVDVFAYPYGQRGDFTDKTIEVALEARFKKVFAAYGGLTNKRFEYGRIPRNSIVDCETEAQLKSRFGLVNCIYGNGFV